MDDLQSSKHEELTLALCSLMPLEFGRRHYTKVKSLRNLSFELPAIQASAVTNGITFVIAGCLIGNDRPRTLYNLAETQGLSQDWDIRGSAPSVVITVHDKRMR